MTGLFKIGSYDYTQYEDTTKHSVNRVDVYEEWTDGDWNDHRIIAKTRVIGSVVLNFKNKSELSGFRTAMALYRNSDGYTNIEVWCNNLGAAISAQAFLDLSGTTEWDVTAPLTHYTVTVTITGR